MKTFDLHLPKVVLRDGKSRDSLRSSQTSANCRGGLLSAAYRNHTREAPQFSGMDFHLHIQALRALIFRQAAESRPPLQYKATNAYIPKGCRGFTLVELLCVVAIIAILASLMMPEFEQIQKRAQSTLCGSNLRQIGIAVRLYLSEHDNTYPYIDPAQSAQTDDNGNAIPDVYANQPDIHAQSLLATLQPYGVTDKLIQCPADMASGANSSYHKYGSSYMWIPLADGDNASSPQILRRNGLRIASPSRLKQAQDFTAVHKLNAQSTAKINTLYADGHVVTP